MMQLIQFKSMSSYNTELPEERSVFEVVKIITLVPTFRTTIADYYQGTSQLSDRRQHQSHL